MDGEPGWVHDKWRPAIAWMYLLVNVFDFLLTPYILAIFSHSTQVVVDWHPLTLQSGGLFHVSMLAIIGVSAWGRTQEKITALQTEINKDKKVD